MHCEFMTGKAADQRKIKAAEAAWWAVGNFKISLASHNLAYASQFYDRHIEGMACVTCQMRLEHE